MKFNCFVFITGILARVTEGDKSDMQKLGYEYIRLVIKDLSIHYLKHQSGYEALNLENDLRKTENWSSL